MADTKPSGPVETGAEIDFAEHVKTFHLFVNLAKYGALTCAALLLSMAFGFYTSAGFISALILFILIIVVGAYILR